MPEMHAKKFGMLLSGFPRLSETFVLHELLAFERRGLPMMLFPLKPGQAGPLPAAVDALQAERCYVPVRYTLAFFKGAGKSVGALLRRQPRRTASLLLAFLLSGKKERECSCFKSACRLLWLAGQVRRHGITHLHAQFAHDPATMAWWLAHLLDMPYSFTAHAKDIYCYSQKWLARKLRDAEFVVTCTGYNRRYLQRVSPNGRPIYCLYHGIDLQQFSPRAQDASGPSQRRSRKATSVNTDLPGAGQPRAVPLLLAVGRLVEKKGFPYLIEACGRLKQLGRRFRCIIAGDGPQRPALLEQIAWAGLGEAISLPGALPPSAVRRLYQQADVFVMPSFVTATGDRDGIPNVVLEAMACGLPVVATEVSGIPEAVIHEKTGLLVPPQDAGALAAAIIRLLESPALRSRFGTAGRRRVQHLFALDANAQRKMELMLS